MIATPYSGGCVVTVGTWLNPSPAASVIMDAIVPSYPTSAPPLNELTARDRCDDPAPRAGVVLTADNTRVHWFSRSFVTAQLEVSGKFCTGWQGCSGRDALSSRNSVMVFAPWGGLLCESARPFGSARWFRDKRLFG